MFYYEQLLTYLYMLHALSHIVIVCPSRFYFVVSNHYVEKIFAFKTLIT